MPRGELHQWSVVELAGALARREVSAVEAVDHLVDRVVARNEPVNLVVALDVVRARATAAAIDTARVNELPVGPLAGVPMTVKDSLMTEGLVTTSGAPELADFVPDRDAVVVERLRRAGAVIYGKTNMPIYGDDVQSFNQVYGTANNPWDRNRSVGGSSGGSAGALAARFTPLEMGSDIAGSIRNPASMCGVVGHKPSYGIVSARGQIPGPPGTLTQADLAVVGPLARTVADCDLALGLLAGPDDWHDPAWSLTLPPPRTTRVDELRVAVWADDDHCPVDPEISAAIRAVAGELAAGGATVDHVARPDGFDFARADGIFDQLLGAAEAASWSHAEIEELAAAAAAGETVSGGLGVTGASIRHRGWLSANERRLQMRAAWRRFFADWDVVLAPVSPTVAIPHDHSMPMSDRRIDVAGTSRPYTDQMRWMGLFGVSYLPVTVVPIGLHSSGLPFGVQVVGPFLEDRTALAAAALVETIAGGTPCPPGWD
ncbi:MAG: amidase [Acidimicrobiales bacterium]